MPVSAVDCVQPAIQHTRDQMFKRFRFGQWARFALLGILGAELHSSGCNFNFNLGPYLKQGKQQGADELLPRGFPSGLPHIDPARLGQVLVLAGLALLALAIVLLVFLYIGSVFRFILFDSVLRSECSIREGWRRWHSPGRRYFWWQMLFQFVAMGLIVIAVGGAALLLYASGAFKNPDRHVGGFVLAVLLIILAVLVFALIAWIVQTVAKDFLVPVMALENVGFGNGWSRVLAMIRTEPGRYVVYLLMKLVLSIAAGILFSILSIIPVLIVSVPAVLIVIAAVAAGAGWTVTTISLAIIFGTMLFAILIYLIALVSVPATVFFPAYSIYFFASRYPQLDALLHPAPPAAPPEIPPPGVPPLPPSPEPIG